MDLREKILIRQDPAINEKLSKARVAILGCGGLGSNVAILLARAGVGSLVLFDYDKVDYSNLNRQNFDLNDIDRLKTYATRDKIKAIAPYCQVACFNHRLDKPTLESYLDQAPIFVEAFDDPKAKAMAFDLMANQPQKYLVSVSGIGGLGDIGDVQKKSLGPITIYGDFHTDQDQGLYSPTVMLYAALEAGQVLRIIKEIL